MVAGYGLVVKGVIEMKSRAKEIIMWLIFIVFVGWLFFG